jgi:hypothetical protein
MKPIITLYSSVLSLSAIIVFYLWTILYPLQEINTTYKIIITAIFSVGTFRLFIKLMTILTKKCPFIRKIILSNLYLEGTWVGFYIGNSGKERFFVERIEQNLEDITIKGKTWDETQKFHSHYNSISVNIDIKRGIILFLYDSACVYEAGFNQGIANLYIERDNQYSAPKTLTGFYRDVHLPKRTKCKIIKISDKCGYNEENALKQAIQLFENNKEMYLDDVDNSSKSKT